MFGMFEPESQEVSGLRAGIRSRAENLAWWFPNVRICGSSGAAVVRADRGCGKKYAEHHDALIEGSPKNYGR
jgi:hypothetical protein